MWPIGIFGGGLGVGLFKHIRDILFDTSWKICNIANLALILKNVKNFQGS